MIVYILNIEQKTTIESHNTELATSNKRVEPIRLNDSYIEIANATLSGAPYTDGVWAVNTEVEADDYNGASAFLKTLTTTDVDDQYFIIQI